MHTCVFWKVLILPTHQRWVCSGLNVAHVVQRQTLQFEVNRQVFHGTSCNTISNPGPASSPFQPGLIQILLRYHSKPWFQVKNYRNPSTPSSFGACPGYHRATFKILLTCALAVAPWNEILSWDLSAVPYPDSTQPICSRKPKTPHAPSLKSHLFYP